MHELEVCQLEHARADGDGAALRHLLVVRARLHLGLNGLAQDLFDGRFERLHELARDYTRPSECADTVGALKAATLSPHSEKSLRAAIQIRIQRRVIRERRLAF